MSSSKRASAYSSKGKIRKTWPSSPAKRKRLARAISRSDGKGVGRRKAAGDPRMTPLEFRRIIERTGVSQEDVADLLLEAPRTLRRHLKGHHRVSGSTTIVMRCIDRGIISLDDVRAVTARTG